MKTNLVRPLPIPTKIDEIELLAELDAAEGKTIFSEEPSYGDAVILELGSSTLGKPSWKNGVLVFTLQTDRGVRTLRYLTHQVRPIRSLASALRAEEGEPLANYAPDPEDRLGKEYFGFHARQAGSESELVTIEFRNEDAVISVNVRKKNLVAWAREVTRICSGLSPEERDARLVRLDAKTSRTVQVPKIRAPLIERLPDPDYEPEKEYFGLHVRETKPEDDLVTVELRNEDGVTLTTVRKQNLVAWAREVTRICSGLSPDEQEEKR